jgi:hypothetical protein
MPRLLYDRANMAKITLTIFYRFPVKPVARGKGGPDPLI